MMRRWQRECWAEQKRGTLSLATAAAISAPSANEQSRPSELSKAHRHTFGWGGVWQVLQMQLKECFQDVAVRNTAGTTKGAVGGLQPLHPLLRYFMQSPWSVYSTGQIGSRFTLLFFFFLVFPKHTELGFSRFVSPNVFYLKHKLDASCRCCTQANS